MFRCAFIPSTYITLFLLILFFLTPPSPLRPIAHAASSSPAPFPSTGSARQTELQKLMSHIDQNRGAELLLLLHNLGQKNNALLVNLHDCARKYSPSQSPDAQKAALSPGQDDFVKLCQAELSAYTELCLKRYAALPCSESAASLMLHGATTQEVLLLP